MFNHINFLLASFRRGQFTEAELSRYLEQYEKDVWRAYSVSKAHKAS